jgi:hypothetical protein
METNQSFPERVWNKLSAIDVTEHTELKGRLTFLSWTWAWIELMKYYPESTFEVLDPVWLEHGTVMCWVEVTIRQGDEAFKRKMWLPVMDNRNQAVIDPDSRAISDCQMRCIVKCLGMCGLGVNIYAGSDLPVSDDKSAITPKQVKNLKLLLKTSERSEKRFLSWAEVSTLEEVPAFKYGAAVGMLENEIRKKKAQ